MRVVLDRSPQVVAWAAAHIAVMHGRGFADGAKAIGVETEQGALIGAVVFHNWFPEYRTIEVSAVAIDPRWMRARDAFEKMWVYCFDVCKVDKIYSMTPASNKRALKFVWGLGFKVEAVLKRHFGDDDGVVSHYFREWRRPQ